MSNLGQLEKRCRLLERFFDKLGAISGRIDKELAVSEFRQKWPQLNKDLDYCFEVLAGKHKLGYRFTCAFNENILSTDKYKDYTIHKFVDEVLSKIPSTYEGIKLAYQCTPEYAKWFIMNLVNRNYKLGYSNKQAMITYYSPMLAKKYQDTIKPEQMYYIQEKLDGNRCLACYNYNTGKWEFWSRSGKQLKVEFDMSWVNIDEEVIVFDGEIMTLEHAGSRDFNRTSGAINGKYVDKSGLHYFIYDIVATKLTYEERKHILDKYDFECGNKMTNTHILPVLEKIVIYPNHDYNWYLDEWLDKITSKGGEGLILRDPNSYYTPGKRSDGLLKYKKTQTMDLRITGWNEGSGKYEGAIGSFICESDDKDIIVNVAGMSDDIRFSEPDFWIGKIVEVAYFDISTNSTTGQKSLRFPRLKKIRDDKDTTSVY